MRFALFAHITVLLLFFMTPIGCAKQPEQPNSMMDEATKDGAALPRSKNATLIQTLSKEQQMAVRALIRDELVANPEILLEAQHAYETKQVSQQNARAASAFVRLTSEHAQFSFGPANAKITLIEFFDYKCGYCHAAQAWVAKVMATRKDVRIIFKEFPILSENSVLAAKAAIAASYQGKYLPMHNALMSARGDLNPEQILQIASQVGLNVEVLRKEMHSPKVEVIIDGIRKQAAELAIGGTPGFVINGTLISGFNKDALDSALKSAREKT
ncbi:DsbA family protein [Candidatus Phycosocius spiralis]|uniref:Thioredoxin domain-containing protein n=1 Tax=Candidatus Phycosocius spiralis TaxID=2815099 RepID=A0ABQ4PYU7_9PROT|nr:DsbA family protein [Candidatus Phycosocius spiralis]GIU67863.1 hypothetical protein PsB1_2017 [Candidatus Phycosocius spiralis]